MYFYKLLIKLNNNDQYLFNRSLNLGIIPQYAKYLAKKRINGILGKYFLLLKTSNISLY